MERLRTRPGNGRKTFLKLGTRNSDRGTSLRSEVRVRGSEFEVARTGLEPAISAVKGRHPNH